MYVKIHVVYMIDTYFPYIDEAPRHAQTDGFISRMFMMMLVMMLVMMIMMTFVALREGELDHIKAGTIFVLILMFVYFMIIIKAVLPVDICTLSL